MRITKENKKSLAQDLGAELAAKNSFFASFNGMKFQQANGLRDNLRPAKAKFQVVRNSVVAHAVGNAGLEPKDKTIAKGPTAVVTLEDAEEITRVARELVNFTKDNPQIQWKGGFFDKNWLTPEDIQKLSKIGSKKEQLTQLAGTLYTTVAQIRYVLDALKSKLESEQKPEQAKPEAAAQN